MSEGELDSSCNADNESDNEHTSEVSQVITPESQSFVKPSTSASCKPKLLGKRPSLGMLPPKKIKLEQKIAEMATADTEDQYDQFGKHLASQLREVPLKSFIVLQSKIQNLITKERLANLYENYNEPQSYSGAISHPNSASYHKFIGTTMYSEPENTYSESSDSCFMEEVSTKYSERSIDQYL